MRILKLFALPCALLALILCGSSWTAAVAQAPDLQPLINARSIEALLEVQGKVMAGLGEGGLVVYDAQDPTSFQRVYAGTELSGNLVSDLAWSGRYVWVATQDGGLTRIELDGDDMMYRRYNLGDGGLNLTAVTGAIIGGSERVFYAMNDAGIGRIVDGLPGNTYTAEQDGLIDNTVNAMQFYQGDLFVATPSGISRFANNVFSDENEGLTNLVVNDLVLDTDGNLLAGGRGGVFRWEPAGESWTYIGGIGSWVNRVASGPSGTFALGVDGTGANIMSEYDGVEWTSVELPERRTYAVFSGEDLWVGGRVTTAEMSPSVGYGWLGRRESANTFTTWLLDASLVRNATGITFGADGGPWVGSHNADGISHLSEDGWFSIAEVASAENDSSGLFNFSANVLSMTTGTDGVVYAGQYTQGVVRYDPAAGRSHLMFPGNCGLLGRNVVNMVTHPDGPIFFLHDWADPDKVEVLVDTDNWRNPDSWLILPTGEGGLGNGSSAWDVLVTSRDVVWFAIQGTGLVRWDINGDLLGPDDELTWFDTSDDRWDEPISNFSGIANDPTEAVALALADDGSIWVGGNGVVRFNHQALPWPGFVMVAEHFNEKTSPFAEGLINGNVSDVCVGGDGTLWVATRSGLNEGTTAEGETTFKAWFDLGNYLSNSTYGTLYSQDAIVSLPGGEYRRILADPASDKALLCSDRGAVLVAPGLTGGGQGGSGLTGVHLYPNPFKPGEGQLLRLGGLPADAEVTVVIYNTEGQRVFDCCDGTDVSSVLPGDWYWDGRNRADERNNVTTGMYVVRVTREGKTALLPLAVLR
jgi:hypothetical protein